MSVRFSPDIPISVREIGENFSARSLDLARDGEATSPVIVVDDFRVRGHVFGPHPHAGFSAVTYVFEDSPVGLRSRDSLGNDIIVRPGGIVWTQAARGAMHEEVPAHPGRELHGLQVFVNLSARNKLAAPQVLWLENSEVPEWRNDSGDRVRVAVGSFSHVSSPLVPAEPFNLLDVELRSEISFVLADGWNALFYALAGAVIICAGDTNREIAAGRAVALSAAAGHIALTAVQPARLVILAGAALHEPVFVDGPFIMNDRQQAKAAFARYRNGAMGRLAPLAMRER